MKRIMVLAATVAVASGAFAGIAGASSAAAPKPATLTAAQKAAGRAAWKKAGCSGCHALAATGGTGTRGPNLDGLYFPVADMIRQITNGGGYMPSFREILEPAEIKQLAAYIDAVRLIKAP